MGFVAITGEADVYVWTAEAEGIPLLTLDQEVHQRAAARCRVLAP